MRDITDIKELLGAFPSLEGREREMTLEEAESLGINFCGESENGYPVYKFLAREGVMLTYYLIGNFIVHQRTEPLH